VTADEPVRVVERLATPRGEVVLRARGDHFEIISNGTFLMDTTRGGRSERLLVAAALAAHPGASRLLLGGLGLGFSLHEALCHTGVREITVVEIEPAVIRWHRTHLSRINGPLLDDPRVRVVTADVVRWLDETVETFDAICLDIDNGPEWTVTAGNRALYGAAGLAALRRRLRPGGVLTVWSAVAAPAFAARLRRAFADVAVRSLPVNHGVPDVVYVATT
jgi:spermidine synthase